MRFSGSPEMGERLPENGRLIANGLGDLPPFLLLLLAVVMPERMFFAPSATKCRYAFQVADDAGAVVDVVRTAGGTGVQSAFIDMAAFVADGDAHVHAEVVAAGLCGDVQERAVAGFGQGFVEV